MNQEQIEDAGLTYYTDGTVRAIRYDEAGNRHPPLKHSTLHLVKLLDIKEEEYA